MLDERAIPYREAAARELRNAAVCAAWGERMRWYATYDGSRKDIVETYGSILTVTMNVALAVIDGIMTTRIMLQRSAGLAAAAPVLQWLAGCCVSSL